MPKPTNAIQAYRNHVVNGASRMDLLLMVYDTALVGCGRRDLVQTTEALLHLCETLDFCQDPTLAGDLFRLYEYCDYRARQGEFDEAAQVLRTLRETWEQVKSHPHLPPHDHTSRVASK